MRCKLETAHGHHALDGRWTYDQIEFTGEVGAAAVDPGLVNAAAVHILDGPGAVLASARLA